MKNLMRLLILLLMFHPWAATAQAIELVGGWEGSGERGYEFLSPVLTVAESPAHALLFRGAASYLYYSLPSPGGSTDVTSPGASIGIAYRKKLRKGSVTIGPGYEIRETERQGVLSERETERGLTVQGDIFYQVRPLDTLFLIGSFGKANEYVWSRAGYKRQLTNTDFRGPRAFSLGGEITAQGNEDLRAVQAGAMLEWAFMRSSTSLQLRGGVGRTDYEMGESEESPYLGIGFYRRF